MFNGFYRRKTIQIFSKLWLPKTCDANATSYGGTHFQMGIKFVKSYAGKGYMYLTSKFWEE